MLQKKKICMLGATGVGKTSLVARYVRSIFSDVYRTTVGVAIDKCRVRRGDVEVDLVIWDLSGEDEFQSVQLAYLRGASGYLLVVDGTRPETVATALWLQESARRVAGDVPFVVVVNKSDVPAEPSPDVELSSRLDELTGVVLRTSAKTGDGVGEAFASLADAMLRQAPRGTRVA